MLWEMIWKFLTLIVLWNFFASSLTKTSLGYDFRYQHLDLPMNLFLARYFEKWYENSWLWKCCGIFWPHPVIAHKNPLGYDFRYQHLDLSMNLFLARYFESDKKILDFESAMEFFCLIAHKNPPRLWFLFQHLDLPMIFSGLFNSVLPSFLRFKKHLLCLKLLYFLALISFERKDILFSEEHKRDSWAGMNIDERNLYYNDSETN